MPYNAYSPQMSMPYGILPQNNSSGIVWVQGESGAKAYPVTAGTSMPLFDSENDRFFIKSTDASGMPLPLRIFNYKEQREDNSLSSIQQPSIDPEQFVTREEFNKVLSKLEELSRPRNEQRQDYHKKGDGKNGKPLI